MIREIVTIDEEACDGCGECVPACAEGAIQIVDGKAKLVSDRLCDGLGACLGHCPQGAINVERREADAFDEAAVERHIGKLAEPHESRRPGPAPAVSRHDKPEPSGCPSSRFVRFDDARPEQQTHGAAPGGNGRGESPIEAGNADQTSELTHWPIQLRLLPPTAPALKGARLLFAADCVPFAYRDFHADLLRDHAVVIACPKLDDPSGYVEKIVEIIRHNDLTEISVARMEVPCCSGILQMVLQARQLAGSDVAINDIVISVRGEVLTRRQVPVESKTSDGNGSACCPSMRS